MRSFLQSFHFHFLNSRIFFSFPGQQDIFFTSWTAAGYCLLRLKLSKQSITKCSSLCLMLLQIRFTQLQSPGFLLFSNMSKYGNISSILKRASVFRPATTLSLFTWLSLSIFFSTPPKHFTLLLHVDPPSIFKAPASPLTDPEFLGNVVLMTMITFLCRLSLGSEEDIVNVVLLLSMVVQ